MHMNLLHRNIQSKSEIKQRVKDIFLPPVKLRFTTPKNSNMKPE